MRITLLVLISFVISFILVFVSSFLVFSSGSFFGSLTGILEYGLAFGLITILYFIVLGRTQRDVRQLLILAGVSTFAPALSILGGTFLGLQTLLIFGSEVSLFGLAYTPIGVISGLVIFITSALLGVVFLLLALTSVQKMSWRLVRWWLTLAILSVICAQLATLYAPHIPLYPSVGNPNNFEPLLYKIYLSATLWGGVALSILGIYFSSLPTTQNTPKENSF